MSVKIKKTGIFVLITYILTLLFFIFLEIIGGKANPLTINFIGISMGIPLLSVIIVQKAIYRNKLKGSFGLSLQLNPWFALSIIVPIVMAVVIMYTSMWLFDIEVFTTKTFLSNLIIGLTIASISALLEEIVWRGYLFKELEFLGIIKLSIIIGIIWALWHTPVTVLYKYPDSPLTGSILNFFQMFLISIIITFVRCKSNSIFAAALMHGLFNTLLLTSVLDDYNFVVMKIIICIVIITILSLLEIANRQKGPLITS